MWVLLYERMQQRSSDPLELELKVVLATWVLGTDLGSSGREGSEYSWLLSYLSSPSSLT